MRYLPGNDANKIRNKIFIAHRKYKYMDVFHLTVNYKVHSIKNTSALHFTHSKWKLDHDDTATSAAPFILHITNYGTQT
jgi:hypothetical protein